MIKIFYMDQEDFGCGVIKKVPCFEMIPKERQIIYDEILGGHDVDYSINEVVEVNQIIIGDEIGYMVLVKSIGEDYINDEGKRITKYY